MYSSVGGFVFIGIGILVRVLARKIIIVNSYGFTYDIYTNQINNSSLESSNIFFNVVIFIGALFAVSDLTLAIILKLWGNKKNQ